MNFTYTKRQKRSQRAYLSIKSCVFLFVVFFFLPLLLSAASLQIEGERAWLKASEEPLSEILLLFEQHGVEVSIDPSIKLDLISGDWTNVNIGWLTRKLAGRHSYILKWKQSKNYAHYFV